MVMTFDARVYDCCPGFRQRLRVRHDSPAQPSSEWLIAEARRLHCHCRIDSFFIGNVTARSLCIRHLHLLRRKSVHHCKEVKLYLEVAVLHVAI